MKATNKKPSPYGSVKFKTIDEYHHTFSGDVRKKLEQIRQLIRKAAPQAEEVISYNMPAFKWNKVLVYYAAHKEHIGFYPTPSPMSAFKTELTPYKTSKGAVQFPMDKPLPKDLITYMVKFRIKEILEKGKYK